MGFDMGKGQWSYDVGPSKIRTIFITILELSVMSAAKVGCYHSGR